MIIACIIAIIVVILIIVIWKKSENKQISKATITSITFIERIGNMERLRITIVPPVDNFLETMQLFAVINGAPAVKIGSDLAASTTEVDATFDTGVVIQLFIKTIGDNGSTANSDLTPEYNVTDQRIIGKATISGIVWQEHID